MDVFNKITISNIIWYLVPGLGLIFFVIFPITAFNPNVVGIFFMTLGPFGIVILAIILGFTIEGLRLYRFRPNYSKIKTEFFSSLKEIISSELDPYFIQMHIGDIAKSKNITGLSLHHAIWIMLGQFTILSFSEGLFWFIATFYYIFCDSNSCIINEFFKITPDYKLFGIIWSKEIVVFCCGIFAALFTLTGYRILHTSVEDQNNTNKMFLNFAKQHRDEIRKLLNITE
jgi:hypothetical protein